MPDGAAPFIIQILSRFILTIDNILAPVKSDVFDWEQDNAEEFQRDAQDLQPKQSSPNSD